ncbi:hypothetical protein ACFXGA_02625 [Actinosynnema sp. NPDC059335]|uniref:LppU/SCO3897 family protein n=1 Tax=Actinosynnema sp. NPDC059335 TaxID=3346804 RepID=UPI00366C265E
MSNEPSRPADDVPTGGDPSARPDVPPADAERIAAAEEAAASAPERRLSSPASSGLASGSPDAGPDLTPEPGAGARERPVPGNEPTTPAGPTAVPGARPVPASDPVAAPGPVQDESPAGSASADADPVAGRQPSGASADGGGDRPGAGGTGRKVLIAVLVLLLIGIAAYGVYRLTGDSRAEVGDCVSVTSEGDDRAKVESHDCASDEASFQVGKLLDAADAACPEEGLYTEIVPVGDNHKLCLLPNMTEGGCYKPDEGTGFVKTPCTGPETIKVTKVVKGSTDLEACPDGAGMSYPEPAVTYCLEPAEM